MEQQGKEPQSNGLTWEMFQRRLMKLSRPVRETDANYFAAQEQIERYSGEDWDEDDWE